MTTTTIPTTTTTNPVVGAGRLVLALVVAAVLLLGAFLVGRATGDEDAPVRAERPAAGAPVAELGQPVGACTAGQAC